MRLNIILLTILLPISSWAANNASRPVADTEPTATTSCSTGADTSHNYNATKWYRDSAERNAQYNQVFSIGLEKVATKVKPDKLRKTTWGVIMDIDETVLDNSTYAKNNVLTCTNYSAKSNYAFMEEKASTATPGAHKFTCEIQKMGGKVVLVTNRDGNFDANIRQATVDNLKSAGICFDNVVFANGPKDSNKTPRFTAVTKGDYSQIIAINKLKPLHVVAYFGDNIQDFPNISQKEAIKQDPNGSYFQKFGEEYFSLPNPTYGSWEANQFN